MGRLSGRRPKVAGVLASVCLGLSAVISLQLDDGPLPRSARPSGGGATAWEPHDSAVDLGFAMPPLAVFAEIAARPLFAPTRRPPPADPAPPAAPEAPLEEDQFLLRGVAIAGDRRVALVERRATGEFLRALPGGKLDGWRVGAITARTIVLENGGESYVLEAEQDVTPAVLERLRASEQTTAASGSEKRLQRTSSSRRSRRRGRRLSRRAVNRIGPRTEAAAEDTAATLGLRRGCRTTCR